MGMDVQMRHLERDLGGCMVRSLEVGDDFIVPRQAGMVYSTGSSVSSTGLSGVASMPSSMFSSVNASGFVESPLMLLGNAADEEMRGVFEDGSDEEYRPF